MRIRRLKGSLIMLLFVLAVCMTAKITETAVQKTISASVAVSSDIVPKENDISVYRTERQQLRQMQKTQLNDIIYDQESDADIVKSAQEQLLYVIETERTEATLESMLQLRGFEDAVVIMNKENINVLIKQDDPKENKTAVIMDVIASGTDISAGNVKIIPIN